MLRRPYETLAIPHYMSGKVREIEDPEFEAISVIRFPMIRGFISNATGSKSPMARPFAISKYAPGWFGRFFERAIRHIVHLLRHIGHRADANTLVIGVLREIRCAICQQMSGRRPSGSSMG